MNLVKCLSCGGALEQDKNVYICKNCGETFKENEIAYLKEVEPALRINVLFDDRVQSVLAEEEEEMDGFLGETLSNLSSDDTLVFNNGEQKKIISINKIGQINLTNKRISIAPNKKVSVIVSGKLNSNVARDTIVYKLVKK